MRLEVLEHDHRLRARLFQRIAALVSGEEIDDVGKTAMHRPFLERLSRAPDDVTAADIAPLRAAGVPDAAIVDALHVNAVFNLVPAFVLR